MGCTWQWETHGDRRNVTQGSTWNDDTYNNANAQGWARMMDGLKAIEREGEGERHGTPGGGLQDGRDDRNGQDGQEGEGGR